MTGHSDAQRKKAIGGGGGGVAMAHLLKAVNLEFKESYCTYIKIGNESQCGSPTSVN